MSEMFRPTPPPAAQEHEQHDLLLVSQLAAGDPLDPERAQQAQAWLATCAECARLAADLRTVRAAVASEPVPARRRDFRLSPEQAEALQGNALTRFLRGLSLPRTRAFAPAAAGIMSIGLVFVVAGYAWPEGSTLTVGTEAEVAPAVLEEPAAGTPVPAVVAAPTNEIMSEPAAPGAAAEDLEFFAGDPDALEEALLNQVGAPPRSEAMRKAIEAEAEAEVADEVGAAEELQVRTPPTADGLLESAVAESDAMIEVPAEGGLAADDEALDVTAGEQVGETTGDQVDAADRTAREPAADEAAMGGAAVGDEPAEVGAAPLADDDGLERWLLLIGVVLAGAGALLLLLGWLSRRAADPLLR